MKQIGVFLFVVFCGILVGFLGSLLHGYVLVSGGNIFSVGIVLVLLFLFSVQFFVGVLLKNCFYVWLFGLVTFFVATLAASSVWGSYLILANGVGYVWLFGIPIVTFVVVKLVKVVLGVKPV